MSFPKIHTVSAIVLLLSNNVKSSNRRRVNWEELDLVAVSRIDQLTARPLDTASDIHHHARLPSACRRPQVQLMVGHSLDVAQDDVMLAVHRLAPNLGREAGLCQ